MRVICEEEWEVEVGKKLFTLNGKQIDMLKEATKDNFRGIVWFDKFAVSIPHIQSIKRVFKKYWKNDGNIKIEIGEREYLANIKELEVK